MQRLSGFQNKLIAVYARISPPPTPAASSLRWCRAHYRAPGGSAIGLAVILKIANLSNPASPDADDVVELVPRIEVFVVEGEPVFRLYAAPS